MLENGFVLLYINNGSEFVQIGVLIFVEFCHIQGSRIVVHININKFIKI